MIESKGHLLSYLKRFHTGRQNAIYAMQLARAFNDKETAIRRTIHKLRAEDKEPILSSIDCGYWFAKDRKEATEYIATQKSRICEISEAMAGVMDGLDRYFEMNLFDQEVI